jgi:WD40 repeat protein
MQVISPENAHNLVQLELHKKNGEIADFSVQNENESVWSVAFSPDGNILASGTLENGPVRLHRVRLYSLLTGELLAEINPQVGEIYSIAFSPDGKMLAVGGGSLDPLKVGGVQIWDVATLEQILKIDSFSCPVWSLAFSPDSALLAIGWGMPWGCAGSAQIWNVTNG